VQARVARGGSHGADAPAAVDVSAARHRHVLQREVGDPPGPAGDRDHARAGHVSREGDASRARRAYRVAGASGQVDAAVPAARERVRAGFERSQQVTGHRRLPADGPRLSVSRRRPRCQQRDRAGAHPEHPQQEEFHGDDLRRSAAATEEPCVIGR
jgi:hypothetical protein